MNNSDTPVTMAGDDNDPPGRSSPSGDESFMTLKEFLASVQLSYATYRTLREQGKTPKEIRLSKRTIRILRSEAVAWGARNSIAPEMSIGTEERTAPRPSKPRKARVQPKSRKTRVKPKPRSKVQPAWFASSAPPKRAVADVGMRDFLVPLPKFMELAGLTPDGYTLLRAAGKAPREIVRLREELYVIMSDLSRWMESRGEAMLAGAASASSTPSMVAAPKKPGGDADSAPTS